MKQFFVWAVGFLYLSSGLVSALRQTDQDYSPYEAVDNSYKDPETNIDQYSWLRRADINVEETSSPVIDSADSEEKMPNVPRMLPLYDDAPIEHSWPYHNDLPVHTRSTPQHKLDQVDTFGRRTYQTQAPLYKITNMDEHEAYRRENSDEDIYQDSTSESRKSEDSWEEKFRIMFETGSPENYYTGDIEPRIQFNQPEALPEPGSLINDPLMYANMYPYRDTDDFSRSKRHSSKFTRDEPVEKSSKDFPVVDIGKDDLSTSSAEKKNASTSDPTTSSNSTLTPSTDKQDTKCQDKKSCGKKFRFFRPDKPLKVKPTKIGKSARKAENKLSRKTRSAQLGGEDEAFIEAERFWAGHSGQPEIASENIFGQLSSILAKHQQRSTPASTRHDEIGNEEDIRNAMVERSSEHVVHGIDIAALFRRLDVMHTVQDIVEGVNMDHMVLHVANLTEDLKPMKESLHDAGSAIKNGLAAFSKIEARVLELESEVERVRRVHYESIRHMNDKIFELTSERDACRRGRETDDKVKRSIRNLLFKINNDDQKKELVNKLAAIVKMLKTVRAKKECVVQVNQSRQPGSPSTVINDDKLEHRPIAQFLRLIAFLNGKHAHDEPFPEKPADDRKISTELLIKLLSKISKRMSVPKIISYIKMLPTKDRKRRSDTLKYLTTLIKLIKHYKAHHSEHIPTIVALGRSVLNDDPQALSRKKVLIAVLKMIRDGNLGKANLRKHLNGILRVVREKREDEIKDVHRMVIIKFLKKMMCDNEH